MKYDEIILDTEYRNELITHCNDELSALRLSLTIMGLSENEIKDIKTGIATHEVALAALSQFEYESIVAGVLEDVRNSLSLNPHQNAVLNCAIQRLHNFSNILNNPRNEITQ